MSFKQKTGITLLLISLGFLGIHSTKVSAEKKVRIHNEIFELSLNDDEPLETIKKAVIQFLIDNQQLEKDQVDPNKSNIEALNFIPRTFGFQQFSIHLKIFKNNEKDSDKNIGYSFSDTILVKVNRSHEPVIKLKSNTVVVNNGDQFNPATYISSIYDEFNALPILETQGNVDMSKDGQYQIHYHAVNSSGRQSETSLSLRVVTPAEIKAQREAEERKRQQEEARKKKEAEIQAQLGSYTPTATTNVGNLQFNERGLLVEQASDSAQLAINMLLGIPGRSNGSAYHQVTGLDKLIDSLSTAEAVYVIHRIEGAGFGQTGAGFAGRDTPQTHQAFVNQQVIRRFGGSIHLLLKKWGTYSYTGY